MEWLFLLGLILVAWLWTKAKDFMWTKANQHVFSRGDHQRGQELYETTVYFTAPHASVQAVRHSILVSAPGSEETGKVVNRLRVIADEGAEGGWGIGYSYGNFSGESFRSMVLITESESGCSGMIEVLSVGTLDGVVSAVEELASWRDAVKQGIWRADYAVAFEEERAA